MDLTSEEKTILDTIAVGFHEDEWTSGRKLRASLKMSPEQFMRSGERLHPLYLRRINSDAGDRYSVTLPGLLRSSELDLARRVIDSVLLVLRSKFNAAPDTPTYTLDEVLTQGKFSDDNRNFIHCVVTIALLSNGGNGSGTGKQIKWTWRVPSDIEKIVTCNSFTDFIAQLRRPLIGSYASQVVEQFPTSRVAVVGAFLRRKLGTGASLKEKLLFFIEVLGGLGGLSGTIYLIYFLHDRYYPPLPMSHSPTVVIPKLQKDKEVHAVIGNGNQINQTQGDAHITTTASSTNVSKRRIALYEQLLDFTDDYQLNPHTVTLGWKSHRDLFKICRKVSAFDESEVSKYCGQLNQLTWAAANFSEKLNCVDRLQLFTLLKNKMSCSSGRPATVEEIRYAKELFDGLGVTASKLLEAIHKVIKLEGRNTSQPTERMLH